MAASPTDQFDGRILELVNQERAKLKLKPLTLSEKLDTAADLHSKDMALNDYFAHTGRDGSSPGKRIEKVGYTQWTTWGENIAAGYATPESVVRSWMNSPGHRANILNAKFTHMGLGYTFLTNDTGKVNYRHYWTQVFAAGDPNPGQYVPQSNSSPTLDPDPSPQLPTVIEGTSGDDELSGNSDANTFIGRGGDDILRGGGGNDVLNAGAGNDKVYGEDGDDRLSGGKGNDTLIGGNGSDVLVGNGGSDLFVLAKNGGTDTIIDFQNGLDRLGLSGGLTFEQLTLVQNGTDTSIGLTNSTEILASLTGISSSVINASDFVAVF